MDWWVSMLNEYRRDGSSDADKGMFEPPYPWSGDPEEEAYNNAYKEGFDRRRKELGENFKWS